jgi:hypothetical protein
MLRTELYELVVFALYPAWLLAGGADYLCHRRTHIENTAGVTESLMHVAQYVCIALLVTVAALLHLSGLALWVASLAVIVHTLLSYIDVRYTFARRVISPFEQHMHAVLCIVPIVAVILLAMADQQSAGTVGDSSLRTLSIGQLYVLIGLVTFVSGGPVIEELIRTLRTAKRP